MTLIYTDGSCIGNPGPGGWAFCIVENEQEYSMSDFVQSPTTNNRMELQAVIEALCCVNSGNYTIYTDSKLTMNCAQGKWKRKKNLDLWKEYDQVCNGKNLTWKWVKGHNGDKYNELVNDLAQDEARSVA